MNHKRLIAWAPFGATVLCSLDALLHRWIECQAVFVCHSADLARNLLVMFLIAGLPLLLWIGIAGAVGIDQYRRTRCFLRERLSRPRQPLPAGAWQIVAGLGLTKRIDLVAHASPDIFCYGLLRPRIYLTTGLIDLLAMDELRAVLIHERHHLRRRDPLRALLWTMLDHACWWVEQGSSTARLRRELAADRAVIQAGERLALSRALVKLLTSATPTERGAPAISGLSVTNARIDQLLRPGSCPTPCGLLQRRLALPVITMLAAMLCTLAMIAAA
jgi:beta-lactamase regulating signal transducer with metallopeptidase domain